MRRTGADSSTLISKKEKERGTRPGPPLQAASYARWIETSYGRVPGAGVVLGFVPGAGVPGVDPG